MKNSRGRDDREGGKGEKVMNRADQKIEMQGDMAVFRFVGTGCSLLFPPCSE